MDFSQFFLDFRPFLELGNYDQFLTYFWYPIFVYKNYTCIPKILKIAPKLSVLWAKMQACELQWPPLYINRCYNLIENNYIKSVEIIL